MNKATFEQERNKTLLVVEGQHEKSSLLQIVLKCFPEIPVNYENVLVFGADIYDLYGDIESEYGEEWYTDELLEINIPYLISKRLNIEPKLERDSFTNIILIFDYERQDPGFTFEKVCHMQKHFTNASEDGILYINYPMIESYLDMEDIPCSDYCSKKQLARMKNGNIYKKPVYASSLFWRYMMFFDKIRKVIGEKLPILSEEQREHLLDEILDISSNADIKSTIEACLEHYSDDQDVNRNLKNSIAAKISNLGYLSEGIGYWTKMRQMLVYIIDQNILKAWLIQTDRTEPLQESIRSMYHDLDFYDVLDKQNKACYNQECGHIWVLNTCVTFCGEYKFFWQRDGEIARER